MLKLLRPRALVSRGLGIVSTVLSGAGADSRRTAPLTIAAPVLADDYDGRPLAVVLLNLNGFAPAGVGDLLDRVGTRVAGALDRAGRATRLGGDEFLVLLPDADAAEANRVVNRIRFAVRQPADIGGGHTVRLRISAGVAIRPAGGDTPVDALTTEAREALHQHA